MDKSVGVMIDLLIRDVVILESCGFLGMAEVRRSFLQEVEFKDPAWVVVNIETLLRDSFVQRMRRKRAFRSIDRNSSSWQCRKVVSSLLSHVYIEADRAGEVLYSVLYGDDLVKVLIELGGELNYYSLCSCLESMGLTGILS